MQVNFGNLQGFFPMPNSRVLTAPWTKNSQGQKHTLKRGIFSGLIKVVKETGVETRSFNSCFDGNSTSSTESYSLKGIRASICFCAKRQEQLHQLICCQNTFIVDKSPWDTSVILRIICVLLLNFEKSDALLLKTSYCSPSPASAMLKIRRNYTVVVFNIV